MDTKVCTKCKKELPLSAFNKCKGGKYGVRADCKDCCKIVRYKHYIKNKSKIRKIAMDYYFKWKKDNPEKYKKRMKERGWKSQNIDCDNDLYNKLFKKQQGCCAICGTHQSELKRSLDVDHNHLTGEIRGLLCSQCNMNMGAFQVDTLGEDLLEKAIKYINTKN